MQGEDEGAKALAEFAERGMKAQAAADEALAGAGPPEGPANVFLVGVHGDRIVCLRPVPSVLSRGEALNLAAWIVALADYESDFATFRALLEAVNKT